ncbi:MAG: hypothetical protein HOZ81_24730 [Streptomyces sp.]|nr:hypothetical protein [Streptomyces sp.]
MTDQPNANSERIAALHAYEKAIKAEATGDGTHVETAAARQAALDLGATYNALSCAATGFIPELVPIAEYPHPVGTIVLGTGGLHTVVDRGGWAFFACCFEHHDEGRANGFFPQMSHGRHLARVDRAEVDAYDCPFPNGFFG